MGKIQTATDPLERSGNYVFQKAGSSQHGAQPDLESTNPLVQTLTLNPYRSQIL
jgi:hypothetical protein